MFASDFAWLPKPFTGFERFFSMLGFKSQLTWFSFALYEYVYFFLWN
jgi:hypothetical protein